MSYRKWICAGHVAEKHHRDARDEISRKNLKHPTSVSSTTNVAYSLSLEVRRIFLGPGYGSLNEHYQPSCHLEAGC